MLRTKVKASGVTNLTDARYFAARGVEWLGFDLDPGSDAHLPLRRAGAIREWIDGPLVTGEFGLQSAGEIRSAIDLLRLDAVQAGMWIEAATLRELDSPVPLIKEIVVQRHAGPDDLRELVDIFAPLAAYFLINFDKGDIGWDDLECGHPFSIDFLRQVCADVPVILSIDFSPFTLGEILDTFDPAGLNVRGGEEEKTGFKSFDELDEIFDRLET